MLDSPLSRYAGAIALVAGILVIASRVVLMTTPTDIDELTASYSQARSQSQRPLDHRLRAAALARSPLRARSAGGGPLGVVGLARP